MINTMKVKGYHAVIKYDPEIEMFRGEFLNLNGGADFYADNIPELKKEAAKSLTLFLEACKKRGIKPKKSYSGKFNIRVPSNLHADIVAKASVEGKSLNQWVVDTLDNAIHL